MTEEFYRWLLQLIREDRMVKFYQSPKWRRLREKAMKRDHYECQECRRLGKYHRVENVHHIKEVKDRPDLALDLDNLWICVNKVDSFFESFFATNPLSSCFMVSDNRQTKTV